MNDKFLEKLEEVKRQGNYAVHFSYGADDVGCDDMGTPMLERSFIVFMAPVGYVGELRRLYVGTVKSFLETDVKAVSHVISNPPKAIPKDEGWYIWGTDSSIESYKEEHKVEMFAEGAYKK